MKNLHNTHFTKVVLITLAAVTVMFVSVGIWIAPTFAQGSTYAAGERPGKAIGSAFVRLDTGSLQQAGGINPVLSVFIPTGSLSQICLTSFAESGYVPTVGTIWCGRRSFEGEDGVKVLVTLTEQPPSGFFVEFTLYQEGAKFYGQPTTAPWNL